MAEKALLGLFQEVTSAADAVEGLRRLDITDEEVSTLSSIPYEPEMLARRPRRGRLGLVTLVGALLGFSIALFLTVGIFLLYPLIQGGQPLVPIPPSLIIVFEVTMLGTMWTAFFGFLFVNRLPAFGRPAYDTRITAGEIGLLVHVDEQMAVEAERVLREEGAHDVQRLERDWINRGAWFGLVGGVGLVIGVLAVVSLLFFYEVIRIPFPTQMAHQDSIGYEQGPRLAAPEEAIPVQGPVLIAGQPASEPVPASADSLQRGQVLFDIDCAVCHGEDGTGTGPLSSFFPSGAPDLTDEAVQSWPDAEIFLIITQGAGVMPSLAENLSPSERWDVANHVHSLGE